MTAKPEASRARPASTQTIQTMTSPAVDARRTVTRLCPVAGRMRSGPYTVVRGMEGPDRCGPGSVGFLPPSRLRLPHGIRRVEELGVGDRNGLDGRVEQHVLRVDQVVAGVLGELELVPERDRVEGARELAVAAEDAARQVDLVDARVALTRRHAIVRIVL